MGNQHRYALVGKSGAGKSQVAVAIHAKTGAHIVKTGAICRDISQLLFGDDSKTHTQLLDDALSSLDPSIFLKAAMRHQSGSGALIIDSLRFQSDADLAKSQGFRTIRVFAPSEVRYQRLLLRGQTFDPTRNDAHRSEIELDGLSVDWHIENSGDLSDLEVAVDRIVGAGR